MISRLWLRSLKVSIKHLLHNFFCPFYSLTVILHATRISDEFHMLIFALLSSKKTHKTKKKTQWSLMMSETSVLSKQTFFRRHRWDINRKTFWVLSRNLQQKLGRVMCLEIPVEVNILPIKKPASQSLKFYVHPASLCFTLSKLGLIKR